MLVISARFKTKKSFKEQAVGKDIRDVASDPSIFGNLFGNGNGNQSGTNHPKRSWFAQITLKDFVITKIK